MTVIVVDELRMRYRGATTDAVDGISFTVRGGGDFRVPGPERGGKVDHAADPHGTAPWAPRSCGCAWPPGGAVGEFSKGMQMRLNLARALVNRPRVLFLDEPTSGLDPVHATLVRDLIRRQPEQGRTVFLTTHDMATAEQLCDRVAFMVDGRIAAVDSPRSFRLAHGHPSVVVEYRDADALRRKEFPLAGVGDDPAFAALLREGQVETIHTREASLDDVFVAVTGGEL